jgi:YD repeat-containing protein
MTAKMENGSTLNFTYSLEHEHAVASHGSTTYTYDKNGNFSSGNGDADLFDAENRLVARGPSGSRTTYVYDGNGAMLQKTEPSGATTIHIGGIFEKRTDGSNVTITKFYGANGRQVAVRERGPSDAANVAPKYVLADHLASTVGLLDGGATLISGTKTTYWPFGAVRCGGSSIPDKRFTGQQDEPGDALRLYDYGSV